MARRQTPGAELPGARASPLHFRNDWKNWPHHALGFGTGQAGPRTREARDGSHRGEKSAVGGGSSPDNPLELTSGSGEAGLSAQPARGMSRTPTKKRTRSSKRIRMTAAGPVRLTPTEARIIEFIERHEGRPCSEAQMAAVLGRNEKTIDRLLSRMRREGIVVSTPVHAENGAQLANVYAVVDEVWPKD